MTYAVFGDPSYKYNNTNRLYGVPVSPWTGRRWIIQVDWDGDQLFNGDNEAIYTIDLETERGFNELYDVDGDGYYSGLAPVDDGCARVVLDNSSKRFSAWNSSGPLYGYIRPGKLIKIQTQENYTGTVKDVFTGIIIDPAENRTEKTVTLECRDGVELLKGADVALGFVNPTGAILDQITDFVSDILTDIGWMWSYDMTKFPSYNNALYFITCNRRAFTEFKEIAKVNRGGDGLFYIAANGDVIFDMLNDYGLTPTYYDSSIFGKEIGINQPWKNIVNNIKAMVYRWVTGSVSVLWQYGTPVLEVPAGESRTVFAVYSYENTAKFIMASAETPLSGTDWVANSAADGSGSNLTANFTVTLTNFGQSAKLIVTNTGGTSGFLTTLQVRGTPYVITESYDNRATQTNGIYTVGSKTLVAGSIWFQIDTNVPFETTSYAFDFTGYAELTKTIDVTLRSRSQQFEHEINDLIGFTITDPDLTEYVVPDVGIRYSTYGNRFRIMRIKHKWLSQNGQDVQTDWKLRHTLFY